MLFVTVLSLSWLFNGGVATCLSDLRAAASRPRIRLRGSASSFNLQYHHLYRIRKASPSICNIITAMIINFREFCRQAPGTVLTVGHQSWVSHEGRPVRVTGCCRVVEGMPARVRHAVDGLSQPADARLPGEGLESVTH